MPVNPTQTLIDAALALAELHIREYGETADLAPQRICMECHRGNLDGARILHGESCAVGAVVEAAAGVKADGVSLCVDQAQLIAAAAAAAWVRVDKSLVTLGVDIARTPITTEELKFMVSDQPAAGRLDIYSRFLREGRVSVSQVREVEMLPAFEGEQQIPCGNDNQKGEGETQVLRSAQDDSEKGERLSAPTNVLSRPERHIEYDPLPAVWHGVAPHDDPEVAQLVSDRARAVAR